MNIKETEDETIVWIVKLTPVPSIFIFQPRDLPKKPFITRETKQILTQIIPVKLFYSKAIHLSAFQYFSCQLKVNKKNINDFKEAFVKC